MSTASHLRRSGASLHRVAEAMCAVLLAIIFLAFILQIAFRYVLNLPTGWTSEVSVIAWLWLVLFGAAFFLKEDDEIRLDLLVNLVGRKARIAMGLIGALSMLVLFGMSLPASYSYVSFMKVERSSYLDIRFDWLFSIYLIFAVAVIGRYLWTIGCLLRGQVAEPADIEKTTPAL